MKTTQKMGGIAALIGAATNLLGAVVFVTLLSPKGLGSTDSDLIQARPWLLLRTTRAPCAHSTKSSSWPSAWP